MSPWMLVRRDNSGDCDHGYGAFATGGGYASGFGDGWGAANSSGFNQPEEWGWGESLGRAGDVYWDGQDGYDFHPGRPAESYTGQELP